MATRFQENLAFPLRYRIAKWGRFSFSKGQIKRCVVLPLAELYNRASDGAAFYNEVLWTKKILESGGELRIDPYSVWQIEEKGLVRLKRDCIDALREMDQGEIARLMRCRDSKGQDLLINLLRRLPSDGIATSVHCSASRHDLVVQALDRLAITHLGDFLWSAERLWFLLLKKHVRLYRRLTSAELEAVLGHPL